MGGLREERSEKGRGGRTFERKGQQQRPMEANYESSRTSEWPVDQPHPHTRETRWRTWTRTYTVTCVIWMCTMMMWLHFLTNELRRCSRGGSEFPNESVTQEARLPPVRLPHWPVALGHLRRPRLPGRVQRQVVGGKVKYVYTVSLLKHGVSILSWNYAWFGDSQFRVVVFFVILSGHVDGSYKR